MEISIDSWGERTRSAMSPYRAVNTAHAVVGGTVQGTGMSPTGGKGTDLARPALFVRTSVALAKVSTG